MRHMTGTIQFSQGWLGSELEKAAADLEKAKGDTTIAKKVLETWQVIDEGIDDLIRENGDLRRRLQLVREALSL
jgi:hypothetical protein